MPRKRSNQNIAERRRAQRLAYRTKHPVWQSNLAAHYATEEPVDEDLAAQAFYANLSPEQKKEQNRYFTQRTQKLSAAEKGKYALPIIADLLDHWMQGAPLNEIEARYPDGPDRGKCKHARHFALRLVPDIAFLAGLPARLLAARQSAQGQEVAVPLTLSTLASAVRQGCDSPECLAVRAISSHRMVSRVGARARYEAIASHIKQADKAESFEETIQRVRTAAALLSFEGIDFGD